MFLRGNSKQYSIIFSLVILSAGFSQKVFAAGGLDNEGCTGVFQDIALDELRERLPPANPVVIASCRFSEGRCDGGFVWQPYMYNAERAWVFYTLPKKGNWIGVSARNICTNKRVLRGDFRNEENSPYLKKNSAFAVGWTLDKNQALLADYPNIATRIFRSKGGEYMVELYGWHEDREYAKLLDSFPVSPL
jgi:hypothetical protein